MSVESDLALYQKQLNRELGQQQEAQDRLYKSNLKGEQRGYASSTTYNQALLRQSLVTIGTRLKERLHLLRRGKAAVNSVVVDTHLKQADPNVLALIALKVSMDVLGKESKPQLVELSLAIGRAIETELRLNYYMAADKQLYRNVEKSFHSSTGTRQKATVFKLKFNKAGLIWDTWSNPTVHKIGSWLLDAIATETGWLKKETLAVGKCRHRTVMRYSRDFTSLKEVIMDKAEGLAFLTYPMICQPIPWSNEDRGGYLTEEVQQQHPLVRARGSLQRVKQGDIPIRMLNNVQNVGYRINPRILPVINFCFENFRTVGKFRREDAKEPPTKPVEGATEEQVKEYKRTRRKLEDFNAQIEQKNWRSTELWYIANKFKNEDALYFPHSFGYRGRIYPLSTGLSPQGTDPEKALLYFKEEGPINKDWLAWHVATTKGLDKKTHQERVNWTNENWEVITVIATDPIGHLKLWSEAEEPWCFLAACCEFYDCLINPTKPGSGLPIGIDATCSGLQHLSSLTLDGEAASLVNVLPTEQPADGYRTVAEASLKHIPDQGIHPFIDRKTTKRTTMTLAYGVTRDSARNYIKEALREKGFDLSIKGRLTQITSAIYEKAIPEVFAGPIEVMKWLQRSAKKILETHETICWRTPSGFNVQQDLRVSKAIRVQTRLLGSVVSCQVGSTWGEPDVKHHVQALSPNLTHSLDSSLLHLTFAYWNKPIQLVHDCCLARSCDMDEMAKEIRLHFVEMYKAPVLADWAEQVGVEIPDGLIKDTLDVEEVHKSEYFFC